MEMTGMAIERILADPFTIAVVIVAVSSVVLILLLGHSIFNRGVKLSVSCENSSVPRVPGLPLLGNLLQLKEKKPYKTFTKWSELYGPVYSIQLGSSQLIVLNNSDVAKEAMVTRFSSISTRKLSNALTILTYDKCMVATSDYNDFHKTVKRYIINYLLGSNAQKRNRKIRETMLEDVVDRFNAHIESSPLQAVNFRKIFESELFGLALKQAIGRDLQSLYVEELGTTLTRKEIFHILVLDMMEGAIEVDWRDFFPYLRWVPNNKVETKIRKLAFRRNAVVKALIKEHKEKNEGEKEMDSFLDFLLSEANDLTETQLAMLLWEPIIESSDTTLISTEWALFELSKDPVRQERLYQEIEAVCGSDKVTEDHLSKLPYLSAVFHETLRKHSPVPMIPIRYVHEDTQIGGYHIPAGTEIIVNLYGCNRDNNQWENPEEWIPERFLAKDKYDPHDLYKTMAFGAGKRVCAGSLQAMLISCTAIGRLVQEFVWSLQPGQEEDIDTVGLTTHKLHPLHAILHHRR